MKLGQNEGYIFSRSLLLQIQSALALLVYSALIFIVSCSDETSDRVVKPELPEEKKDTIDGYYVLKEKPLDTIKHYISGPWQLHYSYGGITGDIRINHHNSFMDFGTGDSVLWTRDGELYAHSPITWMKVVDIHGDSINLMHFDDKREYPYDWGVWGIKDDTLAFYDNANDGMAHVLSKID